ncbi:putative membrane protein [Pedobacter cryoconitis]|uniref:Putative membrane protein n=1 Tax=Pedobacter cryoconitis TaxID=188932 RepID=A0A7W8YRW9_9SPHI|nr:bestrophin family ion channel [Pedobacter cryoconitis]MBB5620686.1 putative membrane protein [Pedobacter cryoconitis]MBB5646238.1 putative membrane protein [Pedobacter cryoconitis]
MINYNPKDWFTFIFHIHKADTFRKLWPLMLSVAVFSGIIAYTELHFLKLAQTATVKNIGMMHSLLGFVISMLLVFRTNTSYDRWWEGRRLLGELTNISRNLAIKIKSLKLGEKEYEYFSYAIPKYAFALKEHLREKQYFGKNSFLVEVDGGKHIPNQVAASLSARIFDLEAAGKISGEQLIILSGDLNRFTDICGGCERIKKTPIPFSYSAFIKKFLFIYVITLPFGWVFSLGYFVIPIVPFILYVLASLELIAEEIENPFGQDANDLPVDEICNNIEKHVGEILN